MDNPPQQTLASGRPKRWAANVHPGRIVLDNQPKRQTSEQKEADTERAREALAVKVESSAISGDKPVKPRPRLRTTARNLSRTGDHDGKYRIPLLMWKTMLTEVSQVREGKRGRQNHKRCVRR